MCPAKPRVAVVDDEPSVRRAIQRLIRSAGMEVESFPSGAEFLAALRDGGPDCVVLDLHMPQVTGFEVQARLAQLGARVPVVIITGHDTPEARARAAAAGASAYLLKPVDDRTLLDAIAAAIAGSGGGALPPGRNDGGVQVPH
jgi:FixJ family two-component response regulator